MASFSCFLVGSETLLQECGDILQSQNHAVLGVISASPRLLRWATRCNLRVIDPSSDYASVLARTPFDYLFSITHLEKIPDRVLELPRRCAINFHDGPLPRYAGLNAPAWAIMNQEGSFGVCWHRMTGAIDQGPVLKRENFEIEPEETAVSLNTKCLTAGIRSFAALVSDLGSDAAVEEPQAHGKRSYFGKYRRPAVAAVIDWNRPGAELGALVRGLQFGPYPNPLGSPKVLLKDTAYIVTEARVTRMHRRHARAGGLIDGGGQQLCVSTGDGATLELTKLSDLRGHAVDIGQLGLRADSGLAALPPDAATKLGELDSILCRSEAFWTNRLATLTPVAAPLANSAPEKSRTADYLCRRLQLPPGLRSKFPPGVAEVSLLSLLLARIERQFQFDLALTDSRWSKRILGLEKVIAEESCFRILVEPKRNFAELAEAISLELTQVRERGTWLRDLYARQPAMRAAPATEDTAQLPVGVALVERLETWKPAVPRTLTLVCSGDRTALLLVGDSRQYSDGAFETVGRLFESLAAAVAAAEPNKLLLDLPLLDAETAHRVVHEWNRTEMACRTSACIHSQIEEQARRTPERTALVFEDTQLSYQALNERADLLAAHLIERGVRPESLVGVYITRSINMVVATLAVLKAGGAYVPLDPRFPSERIRYMAKDADLSLILTQKALRAELGDACAQVILVDDGSVADATPPAFSPPKAASAENLAYVIYTSGSTGRPKGVMVEHRNVTNFFAAMDACIDHQTPGTWLAVTSLSFDISVLELFWTLARGFKVVIQGDVEDYFAPDREIASRPLGFSLFMWGNDDAPGRDKYRLMMEGAKYFDRNGFEAVWTPERHFHAFGGPYPNPSVTGAALAAITERIGIRAGSCVSPLHHPIRIAEEWAVVDNLSNGRVALAFASGWQPNDFILRPENHANNKVVMLDQIDQVRRLWRGEKVSFRNPLGQEVAVGTLPRPVQGELPFWVTTAGNPDTYRQAGEHGANVLTHLLGQSVDEVADKIRIYRQARAAAGHDPASGRVTLMLHTFVGDDDASVREIVREPMKNYLRSSLKLALDFAWSFPAFKRPGGNAQRPQDVDLRSLPEAEIEAILDFAFERYFETSGLFGTPSTCAEMVRRCKSAGVDEIACLLDFGVPTECVLASLPYLNQVRESANAHVSIAADGGHASDRFSVAAQIRRHHVTHLQCTPSMARMLLLDEPTRAALSGIRQMMIGGETVPAALARELRAAIGGSLHNMYGPTETTIWSATHSVGPGGDSVPIGRPVGNTQIYILDAFGHPLPAGVPGELFIGGAGVARGYLHQPDLTSARFCAKRFLSDMTARMYRTGDLARFLPDGTIDFLGRVDRQVKIRGYRVELEEIERLLNDHPDVEQAAVVAHGSPDTELRLIAYLAPAGVAERTSPAKLREYLRRQLPDYMVPDDFVMLDRLPLTPNEKIDRKALPVPNSRVTETTSYVATKTATEQAVAMLWQNALRVDRIGASDNFFELGGHSLLAVQVVSRVRQQFGVELPLRSLFERPTVAGLAEVIDLLSWSARSGAPTVSAPDREEIEI